MNTQTKHGEYGDIKVSILGEESAGIRTSISAKRMWGGVTL